MGLAYFYFDYHDQTRQSVIDVTSSLLKQWSIRRRELVPAVRTLYRKHQPQKTRPDLRELLECIKYSVTSFSFTFVVLDALDECDANQFPKLRYILNEFNLIGIRIFSTSRPHIRDMHDFFQTAEIIEIRADILDLKNYLTIQLEERMPHNKALQNKVIESLSMKADGM